MRKFPELKIVQINEIIVHEHADLNRVNRLKERLKNDGFIKNPLIVARIPHNKNYLLLDGVTRFTSLKKIGAKFAFVQAVDYMDPELTIDSWYHLVAGIKKYDFIDQIGSLKGIHIKKEVKNIVKKKLKDREIFAYFITKNKEYYSISNSKDNLFDCIKKLNKIVNFYKKISEIYRVKYEEVDTILEDTENSAGVLIFPIFSKEELIKIGLKGVPLPAGITRHTIPERALNFNFPLSTLIDEGNLNRKNSYLKMVVKNKIKNKNVRMYSENIYIFDE